ncbi:MAG: DUF4126 domain-containing protein [Anaerolineales bacterium]|nr:DUF4126 domain-containing protein [Anaerolineales bacterium]
MTPSTTGFRHFGRPVAGAVLFAASSGVVGDLHPALAFIAGLILAGSVHVVKTAARPMVTATTAGTGNWAVSLIEDVLALVGTVMAILAPILVALTALFGVLLGLWWWGRHQRRLVAV